MSSEFRVQSCSYLAKAFDELKMNLIIDSPEKVFAN